MLLFLTLEGMKNKKEVPFTLGLKNEKWVSNTLRDSEVDNNVP